MFFGELCLSGLGARLETATAMEESFLEEIPFHKFLERLARDGLLEGFIKYLTVRIADQQQVISNLVTVDSEQRLGKTLLQTRTVLTVVSSVLVVLIAGTMCFARQKQSKDYRDAVSQSTKAARVFREIMRAPDKAVPGDILDKAECVAVFPEVLKAGFVFGARGGRGVASCRTTKGWSAPAFFNLKGGSVGLQIGAQSTDFILLFMNKKGLDRLMGDTFEIGGDASAAAGPVGRQAGASTNIRMDAEILSYSRSKGLFAGLELKGVVITLDDDDMMAVYGEGAKARAVLRDGIEVAPNDVRAFPTTLRSYSKRKAH